MKTKIAIEIFESGFSSFLYKISLKMIGSKIAFSRVLSLSSK
jgi:hypothetical protein